MTIIYSEDSGQIYWPDTDLHDPNSEKDYYISYRPPVRQSNKAYVKDVDVVILSVDNGCMYECVSGGISASSPPTFNTIEGGYTDDGTVRWKCKPLISKLKDGDTITTSTWTGDTGVTLTNPDIIGDSTVVKVTATPSGATSFKITNRVVITRSNGRTETFDKTLVIPIAEL
jgi:hypothetical protein